MRTRRYTARINNKPRTQAVPAAKMGMLNEIPPADTEAHSAHTETSSFPTAESEAQLGQQVFMGQILLLAIQCQQSTPQIHTWSRQSVDQKFLGTERGQAADLLIPRIVKR